MNGATIDRQPPRRPARPGLHACLLAGLLLLAAASGHAQTAVKQVLMLQSLHRGNMVLDRFTGDFRIELDQRTGRPVNLVQVVVGPSGTVGASDRALLDYIASMYVNRPPDLIVTAGGPAAAFARKYRAELFPERPLLLASVDTRYLQGSPIGKGEAAVAVTNDFARLIDDILRVRPQTRQVFMIVGSGALSRFWRPQLDASFARFEGRVTFIWSEDLSLEDILRRCASLPPNSAIAYLAFGTDAQGGAYADEQVFAQLHARANAPLFSNFTTHIGIGTVGGTLMPVPFIARDAALVAAGILEGRSPASFQVPARIADQSIYDWRELQRWKIPESRLPPGSEVRFRPPGLWEEHRSWVIPAIALLVLQTLLIVWFMFERRARRRAEMESRRNLDLAADANRRETISALTSSIGHELAQPLSSIVHNTQALQMMMRDRAPTPEEAAEVLGDIEGEADLARQIIDRHRTLMRSHQLEKEPTDLHRVIDESLALIAHDLRARRIEARRELSLSECMVDGDPVLLEQVLLNLLRNAVDAMAATPGVRRITIRSQVTGSEVAISVSDTGPGVPAGSALFTPFVTTKPHGLGIGLVITQRILEAHGGAIQASRNADGGATFTITLPRVRTASAMPLAPA